MAEITHEDIGEDLRRIVLSGRLDTPGTNAISEEFSALAATERKGVIVDLTTVEFLASIGIGQLISNARAVRARGGNLVILARGSSAVMISLTTTGIDKMIPVTQYPHEAQISALRGF